MPQQVLVGIFGDLLANEKDLVVAGVGESDNFKLSVDTDFVPTMDDFLGSFGVGWGGGELKVKVEVGVVFCQAIINISRGG